MKIRLLHCAACFGGLVFTFFYVARYDGSEFNGGKITGPIFQTFEFGSLAFLATAPIALLPLRRISLAITAVASLLCLPLYLYTLLPGPVRWLFPGNYSVPMMSTVNFEKRTILGMFALVLAVGIGWRSSRREIKVSLDN